MPRASDIQIEEAARRHGVSVMIASFGDVHTVTYGGRDLSLPFTDRGKAEGWARDWLKFARRRR
ncbi:hypothetical protein FHS96_004963 [Sphingomonas zeicaulis]|uniref:hypothetical protein n=1 Tax=Sphingomonas zeicaulis TaxID=1632740 RepID=UPI003D1A2A65